MPEVTEAQVLNALRKILANGIQRCLELLQGSLFHEVLPDYCVVVSIAIVFTPDKVSSVQIELSGLASTSGGAPIGPEMPRGEPAYGSDRATPWHRSIHRCLEVSHPMAPGEPQSPRGEPPGARRRCRCAAHPRRRNVGDRPRVALQMETTVTVP